MIGHAKYSASGSERWLNCPGSIRLSENAPEQPESLYAAEGTRAHEIFEYFMLNRRELSTNVYAGLDASVDPEMMACARDSCFSLLGIVGPEHDDMCIEAETRVDLSFISPNMFGTADAIIADTWAGVLTVADFKYGAGVPVDVYPNSQLMYYALGVSKRYDHQFKTIRLVILQPRAEHKDGPVRAKEITLTELLTFEDVLKIGVMECEYENAELRYGKWCRWCPAATICPEISGKAIEAAQADFEGVLNDESNALVPVNRLDEMVETDLGRILNACDRLDTWIKEVRKFALNRLNSGVQIEGWKLVEKRAQRVWVDSTLVATEARKKFGDVPILDVKLKSPAQLEKILKDKKWVAERVKRESSGWTMVPDSDKRQAIDPWGGFLEA